MKAGAKKIRLQHRIKAWQEGPKSNETAVVHRYKNGGYKCPGSYRR